MGESKFEGRCNLVDVDPYHGPKGAIGGAIRDPLANHSRRFEAGRREIDFPSENRLVKDGRARDLQRWYLEVPNLAVSRGWAR